jgi:DNA-binding NarL/FixJ family response regulator
MIGAQAAPIVSGMKLKVVVAAGRSATRSSLWWLLETEPALEPVGAVGDLPAAIRAIRTLAPDVLIVDRTVLGEAGLRRLPMLAAERAAMAVVLVGMGDHPGIEALAREAGAAAYIRLDEAAERVGSFAEMLAS